MESTSNTKKKPTVQEQEEQRKRLQGQVDDTKEVLIDTIGQLIDRGLFLESVADKTDETEDKSLEFTGNARKMRIKAQFKSWALTASIVGAVIGGFYGLSMGASLPMMFASAGIVGALFYGGMWMCSGVIQSFIGLPFFKFSFQPEIQPDEKMRINTASISLASEAAVPMLYAYQPSAEIFEENFMPTPNLTVAKNSVFTQ